MMEEIPIGEDSVPAAVPEEEWRPIGASEPGPSSPYPVSDDEDESSERLRELEEEQEQLNNSLFALTTHFAQVQFRLQQIVKTAGAEEKEALLKELEEFAFRGCPDINERRWHSNDPGTATTEHDEFMTRQREKQVKLIGQLKEQLADLERFAYESGDAGLPTVEMLEKQNVIIEQMRQGMDLDLDSLDQMSPEDLQRQVDAALKRLMNPMKVKDQLVSQLKTQITDLERFIEFLQLEGGSAVPCTCKEDAESKEACFLHGRLARAREARAAEDGQGGRRRRDSLAAASDFLSLYLLHYLGCRSRQFRSNQLKGSAGAGQHWGDLRAALSVAVESVVEAVAKHEASVTATLNPYASDEEELDDVFDQCDEEIVTAVRKELAPALRDLLQHGQQHPRAGFGASLGCIGSRARAAKVADSKAPKPAKEKNAAPHAWDLLAQFFDMKHGREFSEAPVRKLTQSFGLDNIAGKAISSKQLLLSTIESIATSHAKLRRTPDAMFKAFVSAALNHKKLVAWLRMILRTREIVEENYVNWSYVAKTGFDDAFAQLEQLNRVNFALPVDLAVRPFNHIRDAF